MSFVQHPLEVLKKYLPDNTFDAVVHYLQQYKIHLSLTRKRKTILGDYRHAGFGKNHRISINANMNKYEFLITFLHELAHLLTFEKFGNRVAAHGIEWKKMYSLLLKEFVAMNVFPADIVAALKPSIANPSATANGEIKLLTVLKKYNDTPARPGYTTVAEIPLQSYFMIDDKRIFKKEQLRRTRFLCTEKNTGRQYLFSGLYEVRALSVNENF